MGHHDVPTRISPTGHRGGAGARIAAECQSERLLRALFLATRDWYDPATTGGDMTMWEQARYLASSGHDVTFVASRYPRAQRRETLDGIKVVRIGGMHWQWLNTFAYYMTRCRGRFDVVVCEGFGGSRIPRLAPLYVREPMITEWHQVHRALFAVQYPVWLNGPLNLLERVAAWVHRNTFVRAGTEEVQREFVSLGFKPDNVFVLPVSIREEWLSDRAPQSSRQPTVVWLGKLRRYKSPDHAVQAMPEVSRRVPHAKLVLAIRRDDRRYEEQLRRLVARLGLEDHVEFRVNVSDDEKRTLLDGARVLVVPSAVEGFGIVVLEANARGVPVVASSGVPEGAVTQGRNGLRYRFGDIPGLAAAVCQVLEDDSIYAQLSAGGRAFASDFAWEKVGIRFAQVVERTVAAESRHAASPTHRDESAAKVS